MKFYWAFAILLFSCHLQAQKHFDASITYTRKITFENKADSIRNVEKYHESDFLDLIIGPVKEKYLLKNDSVLTYNFYRKDELLKEIMLSTKRSLKRVDMISGVIMDWQDFSYPSYKKFKSYKRIAKEDEVILGYKCSAWIAKRRNGWRKIWLTHVDQILPDTKDSKICMSNQLILKQVIYFHNGQRVEKKAVSIEDLPEMKFAELIKKNTEADIKCKYAPIAENKELDNAVMKPGKIAPDIYYREVFGEGIKHLYETTQKSQFTLMEFWGTWCMPCLAATPKIKALRNKFTSDKLSIISFNSRDRIESKIKEVIHKKGMNWEHAYATEKLISIFNDNRTFPRVILLDQNNRILLIGNPHKEIEKIDRIIGGDVSVE